MTSASNTTPTATPWQTTVDAAKGQGINCGLCCIATSCINIPAGITLFVLAIIGAAGAISAPTLGVWAIVLGGGTFLLGLTSLRGKALATQIVIGGLAAAAVVTVGALGIAGILSAQTIGWTILGSSVVIGGLSSVTSSIQRRKAQHLAL